MKKVKRSSKYWIIVLVSFLHLATVSSGQPEPAFRVFLDKKNEYFRVLVPAAWGQKDYEDTRTKVAFYIPTDRDVYIRFIVREAECAKSHYATLLKDKIAWARKTTANGIQSTVSEEKIGPFRTVVLSSSIPNTGSLNQVFFQESCIHFHVSLGGSSKNVNEKYQDLFRQVIASINPRTSASPDPVKAKEQYISWYLRLADLQIKMGNLDLGKEIAREGLVEFPDSQRLKELAKGK